MANWLEKILPTTPATQKGRNLPMKVRPGALPARASSNGSPEKLPNASVIYGVAASALFVVGLYFLFTGRWFTGILVFLPALCFLGYAVYFVKNPS